MARKPRIPKTIAYDFIKSNFFRVIHADGAFGGLSPNGYVHMQLYNERRAIPKTMVHAIEGGELGGKLVAKRKERKALVREVEVDVVMNIAQAEALRAWLEDKIETYKRVTGNAVPRVHIAAG